VRPNDEFPQPPPQSCLAIFNIFPTHSNATDVPSLNATESENQLNSLKDESQWPNMQIVAPFFEDWHEILRRLAKLKIDRRLTKD